MSKRKRSEGGGSGGAGVSEENDAPKRLKSKEKRKHEPREQDDQHMPTVDDSMSQNDASRKDHKSKRREKKKEEGVVKNTLLENGGHLTRAKAGNILSDSDQLEKNGLNPALRASSPSLAYPKLEVRAVPDPEPSTIVDNVRKHGTSSDHSGRLKRRMGRKREQRDAPSSLWTKLDAVGGLMMNLGPVFSTDEE